MQELNMVEVDEVSGGATRSGNVAMILAAGWAGTVSGAAAGSIIPGAGNLAGAVVGFSVGVACSIGYLLATEESKPGAPGVPGATGSP